MHLITIQNKIYEIRGTKVMLDFDLADMYGIETKVLKQSVRRNSERFPSDFMFELTREEYNSLRSQFVTLENQGKGKHSKYLPFVFSEQGVAMLSSVLNSKQAIEININIMRAFVAIRNVLIAAKEENKLTELMTRIQALEEVSEETLCTLNDLSEETRQELDDIYIALSELSSRQKHLSKPRNPIGYTAK